MVVDEAVPSVSCRRDSMRHSLSSHPPVCQDDEFIAALRDEGLWYEGRHVLGADLVLADVKAALATQYTVDAALIKLSDPCARRRLSGETESSSKDITVTIASQATADDGSTVSAPIDDLMSAVRDVDDTALGLALSSALGTSTAVTSPEPTKAMPDPPLAGTHRAPRLWDGGCPLES